MATRRSTRVRNPIKTYAAEQEGMELIALPLRPKRKTATLDDAVINDNAVTAPAKTSKKRAAAVEVFSDAAFEVEEEMVAKKPAKKSRKGKKADWPPPLDQQVRVPPHSKYYPVPEGPKNEKAKAWHGDAAELRIQRTKSRVRQLAPGEKEVRLRPYVDAADEEYDAYLERANTQKMFIINRERAFEEDFMQTVTISHLPSCTCPVGLFKRMGEERCCKHILYVLHHGLKAPEHLQFQNAFLSSELKELFDNAPPLPIEAVKDEPEDGNRKPLDEDCAICLQNFEGDKNAIWCRGACGNNIHRTCFKEWEKVKAGNVTCPFCRAPWQSDDGNKKRVDVAKIAMTGERGESGYENVAHLLDYD